MNSWNIDECRNEFEPEEHWQLKRKFLIANKLVLPRDRLICLAQVLVNTEFLGTKYPDETMRTVTELSKGITEEFRERQKTRLQRTFVDAAAAAHSKLHGIQTQTPKIQTVNKPIKRKERESQPSVTRDTLVSSHLEEKSICPPKKISLKKKKELKKKQKKKEKKAAFQSSVLQQNNEPLICTEKSSLHKFLLDKKAEKQLMINDQNDLADGSLQDFVIIKLETQECLQTTLRTSAALSKVKLETETQFLKDQSMWETTLLLNGKLFQTSYDTKEKNCRRKMFEAAYFKLAKEHYQIIITDPTYVSVRHFLTKNEEVWRSGTTGKTSSEITMSHVKGNEGTNSNSWKVEKTDSTNGSVAMKMMKAMGWSEGTGLGSKEQGIIEPVKGDVVIGRKGLGYDDMDESKSFVSLIRQYLENYKRSCVMHKIIFSNEFSSEQRKQIHVVARRLGLNTRSVGKGANRQLTVESGKESEEPLKILLDFLLNLRNPNPVLKKIRIDPPLSTLK